MTIRIPPDTLIDMATMRRQGVSDAKIADHYGIAVEVVAKRLAKVAPRQPRAKPFVAVEVQRMTEEILRLKAAMAWVGQVRPVSIWLDAARVDMTWDEFNTMREAIGLKRMKPGKRRVAT